ncbi:alanine racemase [Cellulomonas sp. Sa3CUA2]|uniref:Alanine racemase n=1 Tax=Cellulomonas avistercoris TaxID=2762242 RepID=A0ABR8QAI2_9CELL|nr:alanine racemase [Cellulomonas avistercoris]MBD7917431.1 alanine racemase [Cellulomonas avistercoris]
MSTTVCPPGTAPVTPVARTRPVLTVRLDAVAHNTRVLAASARRLMAVVKADGFGLGAVDVARTALAHGARALGVTTLAEAVELRLAGVRAPVLSWLDAPGADLSDAVLHGVDVAVPSLAHLDAAASAARRLGRVVDVHLYLDTGTARDGCPPELWPALCAAARRAELAGTVRVVGVMGHLACAAGLDAAANAAATARFVRGVAQARAAGLRPVLRHLGATAAVLGLPGTAFDLSRVGAGLVGIDPTGRYPVLRAAAQVTAPVVQVRDVGAGVGVGYDHTYRTTARTRLALLPLGYADGLPVSASGHAEVLVHGRRRPLAGRVSMDQVVVDVGDLPVQPGDVATVIGTGDDPAPTLTEWAGWAGTLPHELLTGLGRRLVRRVVPASPCPTDFPEEHP